MGALTHNGEIMQSLPANASQINFDKTGTDLNSTQTENAIKEVNEKVNTNAEDITQLKSGLTHLESGIETFTNLAAGTNDFITVYFNRAYKTPPSVMATLDAEGILTGASCAVRNITTATAAIYARNSGAADATIMIKWVAIG